VVIAPGSTSQSIPITIVDDSGLPVSGLNASTAPAIYWSRPNQAQQQITLSNLASVDAAYASGGLFSKGNGDYRLDIPNDALAVGGIVSIKGEGSGKRVLASPIEVRTLTGDHVRIVEPFPAGHLQIVQGDSYLYADGNPITITKQDGASWPADLTGGTLTMTLRRITSKPVQADGSPATASSLALSGGAVVVATGDSQAVRFDATATQTASLAAGAGTYQYDVQWASGSSRRTLERGVVTVLRQETTA
jgi:hypothetical protein